MDITGSNSFFFFFATVDGSKENESRIEDCSSIKVNSFNKPLSNACCLQGSVVYGSLGVNEKWMLPPRANHQEKEKLAANEREGASEKYKQSI